MLLVAQVIGQCDFFAERSAQSLLCCLPTFEGAVEIEHDDLRFRADAIALDQGCVQLVAAQRARLLCQRLLLLAQCGQSALEFLGGSGENRHLARVLDDRVWIEAVTLSSAPEILPGDRDCRAREPKLVEVEVGVGLGVGASLGVGVGVSVGVGVALALGVGVGLG